MSVVSSPSCFSVFRFSDKWMIQNVVNPRGIVPTLCQTTEAFDTFYLSSSLMLGLDQQNCRCLKDF